MKIFTFVSLAMFLMCFVSCTAAKNEPEFEATKVLERIGGKSETPEWVHGETGLSEEKGKVFFINVITMSGDSRPEACIKAAADSARTDILRHIKDNLTTSGQTFEASAAGDPGVESLTAFLSQGKLSGVTIDQKYWEKRVESNSSGDRVLKVYCAAKAGIAKQELARQLRDATGGGGNPEIRKKLLEQQTLYLESIGSKSSAE